MKAFEVDGAVSPDHHYVLARNTQTREQAHFAVPKSVIPHLVDAIEYVRGLLPEDWRQYDLDDKFYGGSEPQELIDHWSRNFRTNLALSAMTLEAKP